MAHTFIAVPRLPNALLLATAALAAILGALCLFTFAPQFDSFARGAFLGAGCTLLVAAGVALAPLAWSGITRPGEDGPADWRPSGTAP